VFPGDWLNESLFEAAAEMVKEPLTAEVSDPSVAVSVKVPAVVIAQPLNVATPLVAVLGFTAQPLSVAPLVTAIVTPLESVVTVLPN
jgi:hypothetical protein